MNSNDKIDNGILHRLKEVGRIGIDRLPLRRIASCSSHLNDALQRLGDKVVMCRETARGPQYYYLASKAPKPLKKGPEDKPKNVVADAMTAEDKRRLQWFKKAKDAGLTVQPSATVDNIKELLRQHKTDVRKTAVNERTRAAGEQFIGELAERIEQTETPVWTQTRKAVLGKRHTYAVAMLSDIHGDEVVFPEQIGYMNAYDREISFARLDNFFNNIIELSEQWIGDQIEYDGIVVTFGGDMVTGYIHDELRETNDYRIMETLFDYGQRLVAGLIMLSEHFPIVRVPCVVGNHGRIDKKPRHKNAVVDSYDWAMYRLMEALIKAAGLEDKIQFIISSSADQRFQVYDTRFMLTHGDQFRGGRGIAGIYTPILMGNHKKLLRESRVNRAYDWLLMGHWHQLIFGTGFVVNGSVIGYNEFAHDLNLGYQDPQQAFFLVDPKHGMTLRAPIHLKDEGEAWQQLLPPEQWFG